MRRRWLIGFPPWLAQVEANLETRKCMKSSVFVLAFHLGLSRWERICLHDIQTGSSRTCRSSTLRKRELRLRTVIRQCRAKFAPTWASQGGKQEYVPWGGALVWVPNLLPPGRARVESPCKVTGMSIVTFSKVARPKLVLETSNLQLKKNARQRCFSRVR